MSDVYAYRLKSSNSNQVKNLLAEGQIAIGWSEARVVDSTLPRTTFAAKSATAIRIWKPKGSSMPQCALAELCDSA